MIDKCPFCGAAFNGLDPQGYRDYGCGTWGSIFGIEERGSKCYEAELAALKSRNQKLSRVAEAAKPFSSDVIPRGKEWAKFSTRLFDALKELKEAPDA